MGPQFTLRSLLVFVTIVAVFCALFVYLPILIVLLAVPLGIYALACWAQFRGMKIEPVAATVLAAIVLTVVAMFLPPIPGPREAAPRNACMNNLHQIALALESYHRARGCYPPAYVADAQGKPLVSWRVLLLPYMEQGPLYEQWKQHRDEPWDGPHNKKLSQTALEFLHCPTDPGPVTDTSYVAVVGPGTIWPGVTPVSKSQITDGVANTILLVEVKNSGINWMEPRDLAFTAPTGIGVSSNHPGCAVVVFADGHLSTLDVTISDAQLKALLTIAGGESVVLP